LNPYRSARPGSGNLRGLALAAVGGALHSLPATWTQAWPLQLACVAVLAWLVRDARPGRAAALGLVFGTAWLGAATWWMFISLHRYGGLPAWMAVLAVAGLCAFLSLYLALAMAAFVRWRTGGVAADALLFAAVWLLAELARGVIFTGFPWAASGYAHVDGPLSALAPWIGVYGIGAVSAFFAAWAVGAWSRRRRLGVVLTPALLGIAALAGPQRLAAWQAFTRPTGTLQVSLLQGNVAQNEKFALEFMPEALAWTHAQLLAAPGDLVIAPETVVPLLPDQLPADYLPPLQQHFQTPGKAALFGMPLGSEEAGYTNSAIGITPESARLPGGFYRYDKHHLVPFGEFIPPGFRWFTELMNIPLGDFKRGPLVAPSLAVKGERVAPNICYEDLFGEDLARRFADPAGAPTMFANISNIGWFGDSIAVRQHLEISRMRTLELQRPMLRATNTGATAVIDHTGNVVYALPAYTQGVLQGEVQGREGLTPFARWASAFGLWPLLIAALSVVAVFALRSRR